MSLRGPPEQDLGWGLAGALCGLLDGLDLEQEWHLLWACSEGGREFQEALGAEGRVRRDDDLILLCEVDQAWLDEVWVVLDLKRGDGVAGVCHNVVDCLGLGVGNAD